MVSCGKMAGTSTRTPTHDATASTNHHINEHYHLNAGTPRRRRTHRLSLAGEADLARPLRGTRRPLQRVPRRERRGPCTTPARDLQKAVSPFSHTIDASHAATLRGTTRSQNSVTPRTIAGYPCGDSARDLRRPVIDQRATGSRTISIDLDLAKTADLAQKRSHKRRRAVT